MQPNALLIRQKIIVVKSGCYSSPPPFFSCPHADADPLPFSLSRPAPPSRLFQNDVGRRPVPVSPFSSRSRQRSNPPPPLFSNAYASTSLAPATGDPFSSLVPVRAPSPPQLHGETCPSTTIALIEVTLTSLPPPRSSQSLLTSPSTPSPVRNPSCAAAPSCHSALPTTAVLGEQRQSPPYPVPSLWPLRAHRLHLAAGQPPVSAPPHCRAPRSRTVGRFSAGPGHQSAAQPSDRPRMACRHARWTVAMGWMRTPTLCSCFNHFSIYLIFRK
jgi:hypothetical protein